jgi:hypothetical protein
MMQYMNKLETPRLQRKANVLYRTHKDIIKLAQRIYKLDKQIQKEAVAPSHLILVDEHIANEHHNFFMRSVADQVIPQTKFTGSVMTTMQSVGPKRKAKPKKQLRQVAPFEPRNRSTSPVEINADEQLQALPEEYQETNKLFIEIMTMKIEGKIIERWQEMHNETTIN